MYFRGDRNKALLKHYLRKKNVFLTTKCPGLVYISALHRKNGEGKDLRLAKNCVRVDRSLVLFYLLTFGQ